MRDHGGNLDWAMERWGGEASDWVDLSTGINARPYPLPDIPAGAWARLPSRTEISHLCDAASASYGAAQAILPTTGAQAAIQMIPRAADFRTEIGPENVHFPAGSVRVLGPTYNEHAASFEAAGWGVETVGSLADLAGAQIAVVVNPNNPDGRVHRRDDLRALASRVGLLIVDESFADPTPEISVAGVEAPNILVLRSFGKFYGLAGLRLGFVLGDARWIDALAAAAGPWPVSGPAISVGASALQDQTWQTATAERLRDDARRLDDLALGAGWALVGGCSLFRLYDVANAAEAQDRLARHRVWSRVFPYSDRWIRLGLPDGTQNWTQVEAAF